MNRAGKLAEAAALEIVTDITTTPGYLTRPEDDQVIHLVGHSRGGAVNARVSNLLKSKGYTVGQYTGLDGYSTDWPFPSSILGDISIVSETEADCKVNYRVEASLSVFIYELITGQLLDPSEIPSLLDSFVDWRAPERKSDGFHDIFLKGDSTSEKNALSDHLNVTPLYTESGDRPILSERYILDNYVGQNRTAATPAPLVCPASSSITATATAATNPEFANFADGDFEESGDFWQQFSALEIPVTDSTVAQAWLEMVDTPARALDLFWETSGEVELVVDGANALVEMTQADDTSLGQIVILEDNAQAIQFDLSVTSTGAGDVLEVLFNDQVLDTLDLKVLSTQQQHFVSLGDHSGDYGVIEFRLGGPEDSPSVVRLDNISISSELPPTMANADRAFSLAGQAVVVDVLANDQDPSGVLLPSSVLVTSGPEHGSAAVDPLTGHITYTPTADFSGEDSLTYQAGDGDSTAVTAQLTIYVGRPAILSVLDDAIESDHQLVIQFSQPMDRGSVETISSYQVSRTPAATVLPIESARYQEVDGRFQVVLGLPAQAIDAGRYNVQAATTHLRNEGGFAIDVSASRLFVNDSQANALLELSLQDVNNGLPEFALSRSTSFGHGLPTEVFGGDLTADGVDDLLVIHEGSAQLLLYAGGSLAGTFEPPKTIPSEVVPASLATADWNGDGRMDIVVAGFSQAAGGNIIEVLLGQGDGTFAAAPDTPIRSGLDGVGQLIVRDFDRDGTIDILHGRAGYGSAIQAELIEKDPFLGYSIRGLISGGFGATQSITAWVPVISIGTATRTSWASFAHPDQSVPPGRCTITKVRRPACWTTPPSLSSAPVADWQWKSAISRATNSMMC